MGQYSIFRNDGTVIVSGTARSASSLVRHYIEQKRAERRANGTNDGSKIDLRDMDATGFALDLHGVDISNVDFTGAKITKGNFMGALGKRSILDRVTFTNCSLQGLRLSRTSAHNLTMKSCFAGGSEFTKVDFHNAVFEDNVFDAQAKFIQCDFPLFVSKNNNYDGVVFTDPQFRGGSFLGDSLKKTTFSVLTPKLDTGFLRDVNRLNGNLAETEDRLRIDTEYDIASHLENRMNGARFFNCKYKDTSIAPCYRSILWDKWLGTTASVVGYVSAIAGIDWVLDKATERLTEIVATTDPAIVHGYPHIIGSGVAAFCLAAVLHEKMADKGHEYVRSATNLVWNGIKATALKMRKAGHDLTECIALVGDRKRMRAIYDTLEATGEDSADKSMLSMLPTVVGGITSGRMDSIITCTRKNFARALSCLSSGVTQDTSILLCPDLTQSTHDTTPCVITMHSDGTMEAIWYYEDDKRIRAKIAYDRDGQIDRAHSTGGSVALSDELVSELGASSARRVIDKARRAVVMHPGLDSAHFAYNPRTHYISEGHDHTILVRSIRTRKIDNPDGPAIVKPDNTVRLATEGVSHARCSKEGERIIDKADETRKRQKAFGPTL